MPTLAIKLQAARTSPAWQLVLDKFPLHGGNVPTLPDKKIDALKPLTNPQRVSSHWQVAIRSKTAWLDSLAKQHGDRFLRVPLVNSSRLLLHLGRASVLENVGLHADRTTGLPVIPGSAVKGILSTWACWEAHFNEADGSFRDFSEASVQRKNFDVRIAARIFGDNSANGSTDSGEIIFLGAFPDKQPVLELDIVTPHTNAAGDDQNPVPNPFLAIAAGTSWHFAFLAKPRGGTSATELLSQVQTWLTEALEQSGIGAKTAAGYGRFVLPDIWQDANMDDAARQALAEQKRKDQIKEDNLAKARANAIGDYSNEAIFTNSVINRLNKPGEYQLLREEVKKIEGNPDNAPWIEKITVALRQNKDARKRLKDKNWFPKEWLP